ncbi:response regulator transcription factor [Nesterenkonia sp. Hz 6-5]|nr:response regulator transcription factor [Nesterenkonia haasae]
MSDTDQEGPAPRGLSVERAEESLRVLIVDDHAVARRGIAAYLDVLDDIVAIGEASDGREALLLLAELETYGNLPDIVLLDLVMPRLDGMSTMKEIRRKHPALKVVVLTSFDEVERLNTMLELGAVGYLLKDAGPLEVASAIRAAARDEVFIDSAMTKKLTQAMAVPSGVSALTERERTVLILVGQGRSNREIAQELNISERTARTHVSNMLAKLNVRSRTQAALIAVKAGMVPPLT